MASNEKINAQYYKAEGSEKSITNQRFRIARLPYITVRGIPNMYDDNRTKSNRLKHANRLETGNQTYCLRALTINVITDQF